MELVEITLSVGIILFAAVLGFESEKLKEVFLKMQVKLKNRVKDWRKPERWASSVEDLNQ
jgi:hypothetical protein